MILDFGLSIFNYLGQFLLLISSCISKWNLQFFQNLEIEHSIFYFILPLISALCIFLGLTFIIKERIKQNYGNIIGEMNKVKLFDIIILFYFLFFCLFFLIHENLWRHSIANSFNSLIFIASDPKKKINIKIRVHPRNSFLNNLYDLPMYVLFIHYNNIIMNILSLL